jgi:hypothetical protein
MTDLESKLRVEGAADREIALHAAMAALRKYGQHVGYGCNPATYADRNGETTEKCCTCGLDAALAGGE